MFLTVSRVYSVENGGRLWYDAREVWKPLATNVLAGGEPYTEIWDNKPPLWEYLMILSAVFNFTIAGHLLVGLSNLISSVFLHKVTTKETGYWIAGAVAAIVYLGALPHMNGVIINVRSAANVLILIGVYYRKTAWKIGIALALAGCITQYAWLITPVFAPLGYHKYGSRWLTEYTIAGFGSVVSVFLPLLVWGPDVLLAGIRQTFFSLDNHVAKAHHNILATPMLWTIQIAAVVEDNVLVFAGVVAASVAERRWFIQDEFGRVTLACAAIFTLLLFVKSLRYYWLLPLPFYTIIIGRSISTRSA